MTVNNKALSNLASMYKNGKLKVTELDVEKNINLKGDMICKGNKYFGPAYIEKLRSA